jgi:hypothetical protein
MQDGFIPGHYFHASIELNIFNILFLAGSYKPSVAYPVDEIDQNTMKRLD